MLAWLEAPFASEITQRALIGGLITACLCAVVGTWVVLRGAAFLGDAMSHGVLPGVAVASLLGGNLFVGAMIAALAMAYGVSAVGGASRLTPDTSIGLLLVGMLALGVIIVSHSQSYAVDLTGFLFGDVLAVTLGDIAVLSGALAVTAGAAFVGRRAFVAATFDPRKAATLGLRPHVAAVALTVLMAVAIVASFNVVGTLLVFGLLIAPPAAAMIWANTITGIMALAGSFGAVSVVLGLLVSWHAATAGGATIAAVAVAVFFGSLAAAALRRYTTRLAAAGTAVLLMVAGCANSDVAAPPVDEHDSPPLGAQESDEPVTRLVLVDPGSGAASVFDVVGETETRMGEFGPVDALAGDGRFGYLRTRDGLTIIDAGAWTFDHGDHNHYYVAPPAVVATVDEAVASVAADQNVAALRTVDGRVELLDRERLGRRETGPPHTPRVGDLSGVAQAVPHKKGLLVVTESGQLQALDDQGTPRSVPGDCPDAAGAVATRRAVIFDCRDGAIRVDVGGSEPAATPIPFPTTRPAAALGRLQHPDLNDALVRITGDEVWVLDSGRRTWSSVQVADAVAVDNGDDGELLVLTRDGVLHAFDTATGAETSHVELVPGGIPPDAPSPVIEVDSDRAYINNAAERMVYEIDYADALRVARTLRTDISPGLMVETGR